MKIVALKETIPGEQRVALIPESVKKLVDNGAQVEVESGIGLSCHYQESDYEAAGASIQGNREALLSSADMVIRIRKPDEEEIPLLKQGCIHLSFLDPFNEPRLIDLFKAQGVSAVSMEMIPRTTIAQKMDALSSQANLGGYVAVLLAAEKQNGILPMMTTPAGTIRPARVLVIGAGVAGLQAIATARRLGARVEAYDTRPVVAEQVQSLGAKFLKIDVGETGETRDGYAKALTEEQIRKQQEGMAKFCGLADVVITTAQVFGKRAPRLITDTMLQGMKPGSVVVDMAVENGGNVEGSALNEVIEKHGVSIIGHGNLPGRVPVAASQMLSANFVNFILHFWDKDQKTFQLQLEDEIIRGCLITHGNQIFSETYQTIIKK